MLLRKKGQSTAEYAIIIGLVVAVAAGVLQVALKGGIRQKNKQAMDYMLSAGQNVGEFTAPTAGALDAETYSQDYRQTTVLKDQYKDEAVLEKGGAEQRLQQQHSKTDSVTVESIEKAD